MLTAWMLKCPKCGPFLLTVLEEEPTVYRFCPRCGQRKVYDASAELAKKADSPKAGSKSKPLENSR